MSLSYETPLLVIASEKQGPVGTPLLRSREIDELPMRDIRALWAAKSIVRREKRQDWMAEVAASGELFSARIPY
jgi:hypothetical protein